MALFTDLFEIADLSVHYFLAGYFFEPASADFSLSSATSRK